MMSKEVSLKARRQCSAGGSKCVSRGAHERHDPDLPG